MTDGYIELNARPAFSFLEGASLPEELISTCADFGMPAMALIDRDGVYGSPRFHMAAQKAGIRAHIGAEVTCTDGHRYPLLAESRAGYQNLCRLITKMKLRTKKGEGAVRMEELQEHGAAGVFGASRNSGDEVGVGQGGGASTLRLLHTCVSQFIPLAAFHRPLYPAGQN